jgi:hypothetical protein
LFQAVPSEWDQAQADIEIVGQLVGVGNVETDQLAPLVAIAEGNDVGVEADPELAVGPNAIRGGGLPPDA